MPKLEGSIEGWEEPSEQKSAEGSGKEMSPEKIEETLKSAQEAAARQIKEQHLSPAAESLRMESLRAGAEVLKSILTNPITGVPIMVLGLSSALLLMLADVAQGNFYGAQDELHGSQYIDYWNNFFSCIGITAIGGFQSAIAVILNEVRKTN